MKPSPDLPPCPEVERIVLALAKAHHWAGLYGAVHPVLQDRVRETHAALLRQIASETPGELLLGIARDKVLYRNRFLGEGQEIVSRFTEALYLRQVATVVFGGDVTPDGLLALFRYLHEEWKGSPGAAPDEALRSRGVAGITLLACNYKELLARRLAEPGAPKDAPEAGRDREERLWRLLLATGDDDEEAARKAAEEIAGFPELFREVVRRARAAPSGGGAAASVPPEVLRRLFRRIGALLLSLPEDRKARLQAAVQAGFDVPGAGAEDGHHPIDLSLARSLIEDFSDGEFVDLLGGLVSAEGKGGLRLRKIFEILATDRDIRGSLIPLAGGRVRETLKSRNYYDLKTWETVEKLLLTRSEEAYIEGEYGRFLEEISSLRAPYAGRLDAASAPDPAIAASLEEGAMRARATFLLLDLLSMEARNEEFADLLEEIRKAIPNIVSRRDFDLLRAILSELEALSRTAPPERQKVLRQVLTGTDFGQVTDFFLDGIADGGKAEAALSVLSQFGAAATRPLLERLLNEPEANRRRALIRLLSSLGAEAVPEIAEKIGHSKWYFVRNLCIILGEIGDRRPVPALIRATSHPDGRVKREAVQALGKIRAPEAVPCLGRILLEEGLFSSGKDDPLRIDAASALYRIGGAEATGFLLKGTESRRDAVRSHCRGLTRTLGRQP